MAEENELKDETQEKEVEQEVQDQEVEATEETEGVEENEETELEDELGEFKDKYLRLYSEFENFRRRTAKEKLEFMKTANQDIIVDLLSVVDDFERAQQSFEKAEDVEAVKEGIGLIYTKLVKILEQKGVKPIEAKGEVFDTELHEAITQIPAPSEELKDKVVDEIEKGYYLGEKVIRFSKVVIGS